MPSSRRTVLASAGSVLGLVAGCLSPSASRGDGASDRTDADGTFARTTSPGESTDASTTDQSTNSPATDDETPVFERADVEDLAGECPSDGIDRRPGTTPLPRPADPETITEDSAAAYVESYERYYLRYAAMFELGGQTPDGRTGVSPHDFPDVRMADLSVAVLASGDGWATVRLAYQRIFEGRSRGEFTVTYDVSSDRTIRAETEGRASPGPNPTASGRVQRC